MHTQCTVHHFLRASKGIRYCSLPSSESLTLHPMQRYANIPTVKGALSIPSTLGVRLGTIPGIKSRIPQFHGDYYVRIWPCRAVYWVPAQVPQVRWDMRGKTHCPPDFLQGFFTRTDSSIATEPEYLFPHSANPPQDGLFRDVSLLQVPSPSQLQLFLLAGMKMHG